MKGSGLILMLVLVLGGSMMLEIDRHGHIEVKTWGNYKRDKNTMIVPVMSHWKYNGMIQSFLRRVSKSVRTMSHNVLRVNIGKITISKCEYIQIKRLMEQWNIDIGEFCRYSLMGVTKAVNEECSCRYSLESNP